MKKLIAKILLCSLPLLLWFAYVHYAPFYFMDDEYPYWMQQKDYINESAEYNEMVVLGDSVAKAAIRPNSISGHQTANLALGGASVVEMYYTLEDYLEHHDSPKVVLGVFGINHYAGGDCFVSRTLYFHYLDRRRLRALYQTAAYNKEPSFWNSQELEDLSMEYSLWNPRLYLPAVFNSSFVGRYEQNMASYEQVRAEKGWMIFGTAESNSELSVIATYESFLVDPVNDYYLQKIAELCSENNIQFILEQAPIKASSLPLICQSVEDAYTAYFQDMKDKHPDMIINDSYIAYEDSMFGDKNHTNETGTQIYTDYIINTYGYLLKEPQK